MLHFGIREHAMGSVMNGIALHGGTRVYGGTFLVFSDYMRPAVRLASIMQLPVIYVWTHDSIGLGEDGPTHQPVEHLAALRAIPGLSVVRPADANETVAAWKTILEHPDGPAALCLTRQNVPDVPARRRRRHALGDASASPAAATSWSTPTATPDVLLIGTGSEVQIAVQAREELAKQDVKARVVSMPCREWFDAQDQSYRDSVLPPEVRARVSVEAAVAQGWREVVGDAGRDRVPGALRRERAVHRAVREVQHHPRPRWSALPRSRSGRPELTGQTDRTRADWRTTSGPTTTGLPHCSRRSLDLARRPVARAHRDRRTSPTSSRTSTSSG